MLRLPTELKASFSKKGPVVKLSDGKFNHVWLDYALETTENKDLKGSGGIIGFTMRGNALHRWFLARPISAVYSNEFLKTLKENEDRSDDPMHISKTKEERWNNDVQRIRALLSGPYVDPYDLENSDTRLVNIATGRVASEPVQKSLCEALLIGENMARRFVAERLTLESDNKKSLFDPMPRSNVKTMSEMRKKISIKKRNVSIDPELMYLRLMAVNAVKNVPFSRVMSFENSPVPLSLFDEDGTMTTCSKSDFMHKLEDQVPERITQLTTPVDVMIFDGHAVIQSLPVPDSVLPKTFEYMAKQFLSHIIRTSKSVGGPSQVHIVFDRYLPGSVKSQRRDIRSRGKASHKYLVKGDAFLPQGISWKDFLSVPDNKASLAKYYAEYISEKGTSCTPGLCIYISGQDEDCKRITASTQSTQSVSALKSNAEEADTRIVLHAVYAANRGANSLVVCSPDTDVLVLLVHHRSAINCANIHFMTGKREKLFDNTRFIPVHLVHNSMTEAQLSILLPVFGLSGCDTVSSFRYIGKKKAFNAMMRDADVVKEISTLGNTVEIQAAEQLAAEKFVCILYGDRNISSLNMLRCLKAEKGTCVKRLPPTHDSFVLHLHRTVYQLFVWKQAITAMNVYPSPMEYGFEFDGEEIIPKMMSQAAAAPELLNDIVCDCQDSCSQQCVCIKNNQPCTQACLCEEENCENAPDIDVMDDSE